MLRTLLLACLLALLPSLPGCAGGLQVLRDVADVVSNVSAVVDVIESKIQAAAAAGLIPAEHAAQILPKVAEARAVIAKIDEAAHKGPEAYSAVVAEWDAIYRDLLKLVEPAGVRAAKPDDRLMAGPNVTYVDPPEDLTRDLLAAGPR